MPFLWSPSNGDITPNSTQREQQETTLRGLFCNLSYPLSVHFQDWLGQSVSFEFPFHYNYTAAFTCEKDTKPTYEMLQRIVATCPAKLTEAKVSKVSSGLELPPP